MTPTIMSFNMTQCKEAAETVRGIFYLAPSVLNSCSAIGSFFVFGMIYVHFRLRIYYHSNAKILMGLNVFSFLLLSTASLIAYTYVFINALLAGHDCDYLFHTSNCTHLRRVFLFSIMLTTLSHAALVLERAYATYKLGQYEHMGARIGITAAAFCVVFSYITVTMITSVEDSSEMLTNCLAFSSSPSIGGGVYDMFWFQLVLEVVTWTVYLYLMNHHRKTWVREETEGHLGDRFQITENEAILRQLGPLILTSSAIISLYIVTASTGRLFRPHFTLPHYKQFLSIIFVMPHNSLISMTLYYFLFKWAFEDKKRRMEHTLTSPQTQRRSYIEELQQFWNDHYKKKEKNAGRPTVDRREYLVV